MVVFVKVRKMHLKPGSKMGAMTGCFSSPDDKSDTKENYSRTQAEPVRISTLGDAELSCGIDEQVHLLSDKDLQLPTIDWLNLPRLEATASPTDHLDRDLVPHIPANLFFWSDNHNDFDGNPNYKEIVNPKYDAILLKCATAPADWQVPDLRLPMASSCDLSEDLTASARRHPGKTASSLPCIPSAFETVQPSVRERVGGGTRSEAARTDVGGCGVDYTYQRDAYLKTVQISFQRLAAEAVQWHQAARADSVEHTDRLDYPKELHAVDSETEATPWKLPEDEVKALKERSQQYLKQFEYKPAMSQRAAESDSTKRPEKAGNHDHAASLDENRNPDIEYFKQQFAPILTTVSASDGALDDTGRPWPVNGDDDDEYEYYPELLEDPPPRR